MAISSYPGGFAAGIMIRGIPLVQTHPGKAFWVYNGTVLDTGHVSGSNGNKGTFNAPFSTITYAVTQCRAGKGDIVFVKPGHAETITNTTGLVMGTADAAVIGLGIGASRPTLTFSTNATANIPITKANMLMSNILFKANVADLASYFTATSTNTPTDFVLDTCEFRDGSSVLNALVIVTGNATANSMDGLVMNNCNFWSLGTTASTVAISILSATDRMTLSNNQITTPALSDTAALATLAANACRNLSIKGNLVFRPSTSSTGGTLFSGTGACTGIVSDNYVWHLDNSSGLMATTGQALGFIQNFCPVTAVADKSPVLNPATA